MTRERDRIQENANGYIVRNCPAIYGVFLDKCKKDHYEDGTVLCQDCTNCVIKQVIEKCKCAICNYSNLKFLRTMAEQILQLFDIEEINK